MKYQNHIQHRKIARHDPLPSFSHVPGIFPPLSPAMPSSPSQCLHDSNKKAGRKTFRQNKQSGEPAGARTLDHRLKRAMLYRLSYRPTLVLTEELISSPSLITVLYYTRRIWQFKQKIKKSLKKNDSGNKNTSR